MSQINFIVCLLNLLSTIFASQIASIYSPLDHNVSQYIIKYDVIETENSLAHATYNSDLEKTGWDKLVITTNKKFEDDETSYAAGYLEGSLTANRIYNHYRNMKAFTWGNDSMPDLVKEYLRETREYIISQHKSYPNDNYWNLAYLIQRQFDGLIDGYNNQSFPNISPEEFHTISSTGDLFDIVYYKNYSVDFFSFDVKQIKKYIITNNHCSALIKISEDFSDIFFGHNSWFTFSSLSRVFKEYNFDFNNKLVKAKSIMFSSYPAVLASIDDYYITSVDMAVIETTNPMFNSQLYEKLTPKSLLCWQRAMLANRIADNSKEWTEVFAKENSGTYNNQFMALDLKQIDLQNKKINENALWIIEQLPGNVESADVSSILYDHWPSYNVPYFENIRNLSNVTQMLEKHPELESSLSYEKCARAKIFRRDHSKIKNIHDFKKIMRYNNYKVDPLSLNDPGKAIASRFDLDDTDPSCMGAYDGKVSSYKMIKDDRTVQIIAGPTNDDLPSFNFSNSTACNENKHYGLPDVFNFEWIDFKSYSQSSSNNFLKFLE